MKMTRKFLILRQLSILTFSLLCIMTALHESAHAGNGTFDDGRFNFCVSVRFRANEAQLQAIRTAFQNGSQVLADATDGQHRFDTITLVNDRGASQSAEYWIHAGSGRAYATLGQYGARGQHVNLYFDSDFQQIAGSDGDAYTIAHEHAHHAYGLLDEYSGPSGAAECAASSDTSALNFSLMDNYFNRGGRALGGGYTLNEFCVARNHDPDGDTYQDHNHGQSAWEVIAAHPTRSAAAPRGLPVDTPPAPHTVRFQTGIGGLRVMLLLDRSGSMNDEGRLVFAKQGARTFMNHLRNGDGIGVASFASTASINFPLTTIARARDLNAVRTAIDAIRASGSTNIGGGLLTALGEITSQRDRSCNEIIVLLSDGDHNTGTLPSAVIPQLQQEGITVFTVGVGADISTDGQATLQNIATATGGRFFRVMSSFDLVGLFLRLAAESIGAGLLTRAPERITSNEVKDFPVLLEPGVRDATFALAIADLMDEMTFALRTPSGSVITEANAANNPNVNIFTEANSLTFQVQAPEAGTWTMRVSSRTITTGIFEVLSFANHDGVQLNAVVTKDMLVFPEAVEVVATPIFEGESVMGAVTTGMVIRPDGSQVPITLADDGNVPDAIASDGIYTALFDGYNRDGTYTFEVEMVNTNGSTFPGENLFPNRPSNTRPVPPFTRRASTTAVVSGVPSASATCADQFGTAPDFILCEETASTCSFNASINGGTCEQLCASLGSTCVGAIDNEGVSCQEIPGSNDTCQSPRVTEICICERLEVPPPPQAADCEDLFGDAPGFRLCEETSNTCRFNATTGGGTCDEMCNRFGSRCVAAFDNEGSSCTITPGSNDTCQTPRQTEICECER